MHNVQTLARAADYERYLCSLCATAPHRIHVWATLALMHELLKIPVSVSEEMVGMIRVKWWQEQVTWHSTKDSRARSDHPVLEGLQGVTLPVTLIERLCEMIMEQCSGKPPSLSEAQETLGLSYQLLAHAAGEAKYAEIYDRLGSQAALIATIRVNALKSGWSDASSMMMATLNIDEPTSSDTPFMLALQRYNLLWANQLKRFQNTGNRKHLKNLPFFALQLAVQRFWRF
jgi:Squalene/phytoene synthase